MKTKLLIIITLILLPLSILQARPSFEERSPQEVGWVVTYLGSQYDPDGDTTSFTYQITVLDWEKDLSHWVIGLGAEQVPDAQGLISYGLDPTTGLFGLKWDDGQNQGTTQTYSFRLAGQWSEGSTQYAVKGGTYFALGAITGPGQLEEPETQTYNLGGVIFQDIAQDGQQEAGEPGLANLTVTLLDAEGNWVASSMTDAQGRYLFAQVMPGSYQVLVEAVTSADDFNELAYAFFRNHQSPLSLELAGADRLNNNFAFWLDAGSVLQALDPLQAGLTGQGRTIGFWKHQFTVALTGKGKAQVAAAALSQYLAGVEGFYLSDPFSFSPQARYSEALAVLSARTSEAKGLLDKQLLATELNHMAGWGLDLAQRPLQEALLHWAEFLSHQSSRFGRDELLQAKDILDAINNLGHE